jgi:hypothetical protein
LPGRGCRWLHSITSSLPVAGLGLPLAAVDHVFPCVLPLAGRFSAIREANLIVTQFQLSTTCCSAQYS